MTSSSETTKKAVLTNSGSKILFAASWFKRHPEQFKIHFCSDVKSTALTIVKEKSMVCLRQVLKSGCKDSIIGFDSPVQTSFLTLLALYISNVYWPSMLALHLLHRGPLGCVDMPDITQTHLVFYFLAKSWWLPVNRGRQHWVPEQTFHIRRKLKLYPPV